MRRATLRRVLSAVAVVALAVPALAQQYSRPTTDVSNGWSTNGAATAAACTNETSPDDSSTYVDTSVSAAFEVNMSAVTAPGTTAGHLLRIRHVCDKPNASIDVTLKQGAATIQTWTNQPLTRNAWTTATLTVTNAGSISNYGALSVHVVDNTIPRNGTLEVTWIELEVPTPATPPVMSLPTVTTITPTSAVLGATVVGTGLLARGTIWNTTNTNLTTANPNTLAEGGILAGIYTHVRTPLPTATQLWYVGYATNGAGTTYTAPGTFVTEPLQATNLTFTSIAETEITANWVTVPTSTPDVVVLVKQGSVVDAAPADGTTYLANSVFGAGTQIGTGNYVVYAGPATTVKITGLSSGTTYHVSVFGYSGTGALINYNTTTPLVGSQQTTVAAVLPTLSSPTFANVDTASADLGATIDTDGGASITDHGTVWDTSPAPTTNPSGDGSASTGAFSYNVSGLPSATRVYFRGYALNTVGTAYSPEADFYTEPTQAAGASILNLTSTSMRVTWTTGNGAGAVVLVKADGPVDQDPSDGSLYTANTVFGSGSQIGTGNYVVHAGTGTQVDVTGLSAGTTYSVAVYEYAGTGSGPSGINYQQDAPSTATDSTPAGAPTLSAPTFASVDTTSATLGATVSANGGSTLTARGTAWNTTGAPITENVLAEGGTATGPFTHSRTALPSATQIHFRGYASNSSTTGYSPDASFYTEPTAATGVSFSNVTATGMRVSWTSGNGAGAVVLMKAGSAVDASVVDGTVYTASSAFGSGDQVGSGNYVVHAAAGTQVDVTGLSAATTYHVVVYEYAGTGTGPSGVNYQQDTAPTGSQATSAGAPSLGTLSIASVDTTSATLGATITADGGAPLTARGTLWNTTGVPVTENQLAEGGTVVEAFSHSRTALPSASQIYFRAFASNASATGYSGVGTFYTEPTAASTVTFSNVTQTGMRISWTAGNGAGALVLVRQGTAVDGAPLDGTEYTGNSVFGSGPQIGAGNYVVHAATGTFVDVTGLATATTYHVAVYEYAGTGAGASGINYQQDTPATGSQASQAGAPSLTTPTVSAIDDGAATLGATVTSDGGGALLERGTVWNTTGAPITENAVAEGGTATGAFTQARSGFPQGVRIWYRGYATNASATGYSSNGTFFTEPTQASTVSITNVTASGFRVSWTAGGGDGSLVVVKATTPVDTDPSDGVEHAASAAFGVGADLGGGNYVVYRSTGTQVDVTALSGSTTYHVAVYAYAGTGTGITGVNYQQTTPALGSQLTDSPLSVPTLSAPTVTSVDTTTTTLGATVDSDGGDTLSARGTVWNTTGAPVIENALAQGGTTIGTFTHARSTLPSGTKIYFRGYASNSGGNGYSPESSFHTEPTQASTVTFSSVRATDMQVNWVAGGGDGVIVLMKQAAAVDGSPTDGTEHAASSGFGGGEQIGTGNYVVYRGSANSVKVVGLTPQVTYHVAVFEYAGTGPGISGINYQQDTPATGSQLTTIATTHNALHDIDCVQCHSVWGTYTPRDADQEAACVQCHNDTGVASNKADVGLHVVNGGTTIIDCGQCHEVHNSSSYSFDTTDTHSGGTTAPNISFIRWNVTKYQSQALEPLVFQTRPEHFAFTTTPYNGACETCHTQLDRWTNDGLINGGAPADMTHEAGNDCASCHVHSGGFLGGGDDCLNSGCHGTPSGAPNTAPDIEAEFALASHHVMGGTATNEDCTVCHEEANDPAVHADGNVDLIDPDDATTIISLTLPVTRDRGTNVLETDVLTLQDDFCLGCHDSDGASDTFLAGSTALSPFSAADRDAADVLAQFNNGTFHHAVTAAGTNPYTTSTTTNGSKVTMVAPWNQTANTHDKITCFDCHDLSGHGTANQRMLRDPIDFDTIISGTIGTTITATAIGTPVETFCVRCHWSGVYVDPKNQGFADSKVAGSVMEYHGDAQNQHAAAGGNELGCFGCHAGTRNEGLITDNGALPGNIHGTSFTWGTGSFASGTSTDHFMLGGWLSGWQISGSTGYCRGGNCNHKNSSKNYPR